MAKIFHFIRKQTAKIGQKSAVRLSYAEMETHRQWSLKMSNQKPGAVEAPSAVNALNPCSAPASHRTKEQKKENKPRECKEYSPQGGQQRKALLLVGVKGQGLAPFRPDRGAPAPHSKACEFVWGCCTELKLLNTITQWSTICQPYQNDVLGVKSPSLSSQKAMDLCSSTATAAHNSLQL